MFWLTSILFVKQMFYLKAEQEPLPLSICFIVIASGIKWGSPLILEMVLLQIDSSKQLVMALAN